MSQFNDLSQVAEDLRKRGLDADEEYLYDFHGGVNGLRIGDDFFPHWELEQNHEAVLQADFAAIKLRRGPDWSLQPRRMTVG